VSRSIWKKASFGDNLFYLLDLDHPEIEKEIIGEITSGIDVYYDRRWEITDEFCEFIYEIPDLFQGKTVLVIGAGIGAETVVIGSMANRLYINDMAPVALDYCGRQLEKNNITSFETLPGSYELINMPPADLTVACFCVYNRESRRTMKRFIEKYNSPLLLVNDPLPDFRKLLEETKAERKALVPEERFPCYLFY
jgi:predicted nicotinamide N-methyase